MSRSVVVDYREINWPSQDLILIFHPVLVAVRNNHGARLDPLENQGQGESQSPRGSIARLPIPLFSDYFTVDINTDACHSNETLLYRIVYSSALHKSRNICSQPPLCCSLFVFRPPSYMPQLLWRTSFCIVLLYVFSRSSKQMS